MRLFVGLDLPDSIKTALLASMGGVANARWQTAAQLHLTLRFIGEVDRHQAADIAAALGRVNIRPFAAELGEPGLFDHRGRIDALWVGVRPAEALAGLAKSVNAALTSIGLPPESRAFLPHITVARGRSMIGATGWPQSPIPRLSWPVDGFALFESRMGKNGSDYAVLATWPPIVGNHANPDTAR
ncbi:RNA 2',3'-cyclic phosphodiesterase [Sandarakinorhabdus oryzae]|uniref:RNA 2',3'-cyclic phosphodiesterase n=1 Tax=Sandarakinorhabdus oryzae TaxID=2675220 RepID=UPI0012E1290F|nr:RNA 2',3'-cyclic phosphodiesterase [Sandarakinorhabdus oryzae]